MSNTWESTRQIEKPRENDYRTQHQREYARLIHSAAFRRLQNKTQILGLGESDFYRTRLTHSFEVMQIGEGIVKTLTHTQSGHKGLEFIPAIELIQSICLAHDIGHPPFGHGGEVALNYCMREYGGFEGNGQTLRILTRLEKYTEDHGLNPSRRLALGVLKYPTPYDKAVDIADYGNVDMYNVHFKSSEQKPPKCFLDTEVDVVDWILAPLNNNDRVLFTSTKRKDKKNHFHTKFKAFDTSIMDLADDISYGVHDLEDGIALNMVTNAHWAKAKKRVPDKYKPLYTAAGKELFSGNTCKRKHAIGTFVNLFMTKAVIRTQEFDEPLLRYNVALNEDEEKLLKLLKDIVSENVINNTNVQLLEYKGQVIVTTLFRTIFSDPERFLYKEFKDKFSSSKSDKETARIVCDYIAGMTDPYAARLYLKITQPGAGSIFERL